MAKKTNYHHHHRKHWGPLSVHHHFHWRFTLARDFHLISHREKCLKVLVYAIAWTERSTAFQEATLSIFKLHYNFFSGFCYWISTATAITSTEIRKPTEEAEGMMKHYTKTLNDTAVFVSNCMIIYVDDIKFALQLIHG